MNRMIFALALLAAAGPAAGQEAEPQTALEVRSPDGRNSATITLDDRGRPTYAIRRDGQLVIAPSPIAIALTDDRIGYAMRMAGADRSQADNRYRIVMGKAAEGRDHHNELTVHFVEPEGRQRRMDVVVRAYDDGVAFRTVLPVQEVTAGTVVRAEETNFNFPTADYRCWGFNVGHFGSSHEGEFDPVDLSRIRDHNYFDLPFVCETKQAAFAITEADLIDFAGMYLGGRPDGRLGLSSRLSPALDDARVAVRTRIGTPVRTPWRVVMMADRAGQLAESTLVTDLSTPSRVADTSWIKPGKSAWDWWNGSHVERAPLPGYNQITTEATKAFIDFAGENGFAYATVDDGWYVGSGQAPLILPGTDVTRPTDRFNLAEVVRHGRGKGVGIILWVHWAALDAQMEEALAYYEKMGVAGIKVDFMNRDDQAMVSWYAKLLAAAARHRLLVNLHGAFVPRGLNRTYPNFITQEGVLGAEYNKWSRRITARHNVMLAYTRNLLGPSDYTPGGFRNVAPAEFQPRDILPFVQTTRAHGLAMYVVYDSPLALVSDSPDTYAQSPDGLDFLRAVPVTWDETRFLAGEVGEYIAIARRKGARWYIGVMNNETARPVRVTLDFLERGSFTARRWGDGATPAALSRETRTVRRGETLDLDLAPTGGAVLEITPR